MSIAGVIVAIFVLASSTKPADALTVGHVVLVMSGFLVGAGIWQILKGIAEAVSRPPQR